jgi:hypothetical protein
MSDAAGFAAMGVAEALVHTYDITQGLGVAWLPPEPLCQLVVARLLPDSPPGRVLRLTSARRVHREMTQGWLSPRSS